MKTLEILAKNDEDWRRMALKLCPEDHDEVLHETYLKLHKLFDGREEKIESMAYPQRSMYVYLTIRSVTINYKKSKIDIDAEIPPQDKAQHENPDYYRESLEVPAILEEVRWFDRKIMGLHMQGLNGLEISRLTGISQSTIYRSLTYCKNYIKKEICKNQTATTNH